MKKSILIIITAILFLSCSKDKTARKPDASKVYFRVIEQDNNGTTQSSHIVSEYVKQ